MVESKTLPRYVPPMLSKPGKPFDSPCHLFEIKWDGTRAIAYIEPDGCRLMNRRERDISERYLEFECLRGAPAGTVLDGEIVVMRDGKSDFHALQHREQARSPFKIKQLARSMPATYIVFDQLFDRYNPLMNLSCEQRREMARKTVATIESPQVIMSEGIVGDGIAYFQQATELGLEGVIAKRLDSRYLPGERTDAWTKIKRQQTIPCVIIGYLDDDRGKLRSLILASDENGALRYVGRVGSGLDEKLRESLQERLDARRREKAVVACAVKGRWVEPEVYCLVRCMERTADGHLRAPVLEKLL